MDFAYSSKVETLRTRVREFMDTLVVPQVVQWEREVAAGTHPPSVLEPLKQEAKRQGLWNLFMPHLPEGAPGTQLSVLEYAPLAELMGRVAWASEVFNCNAPDSGNMELLHIAASADQREQYLKPLLEGSIRSAFAMTEPE